MRLVRWIVLFALFVAGSCFAQNDKGWEQLLGLHREFLQLRDAGMKDDVHDFSPATVKARQAKLRELQSELLAISPKAWPVPRKVDWVLARTELNDLDFDYRVVRPWSRDPNFYLDFFATLGYSELPLQGDKLNSLRAKLRSIPEVVREAEQNLTEAGGDLTDIAIFHLQHYDGVGQGEPVRNPPPEGVLGWYADLLGRAQKQQPELAAEIEKALHAATQYRDWLVANRAKLNKPSAVGLDNYNWYIKHVRLMPYNADDLGVIGEVEMSRARTFLKIEQNKNRDLPELKPASNAEEYDARVRDAEQLIRAFLKQNQLVTIPDYVGPQKTDAFWIERPGGKRHFWEEIQYRDPLVDHIHASIPGHRFDMLLHQHDSRPIRADYMDGGRIEGWGFYCEEMMLQAGVLKDRPRARELFYIAQLARAARIPAELKIQSGEFSLQQAVDYMVKTVPFMDENLARYDLEIYFRRPGYGMNYVAGKLQIEDLLSARAEELGNNFNLGKFHDEFLAAGMIPVTLTRWEMIGPEHLQQFDVP